MKKTVRIFVFCILFVGLSTAIFSQENEEENSIEIFEQKNVSQEKDFPKNAISAGVIYLGVGLEYERLITRALGVAGGAFAYYNGDSLVQLGFMVQGRVYPLNFMPGKIAGGKLDDVLYADVGLVLGGYVAWGKESDENKIGIFTVGIGGKYAVKGPGGFIISPSLNLDILSYTTVRVQVLFGYSW